MGIPEPGPGRATKYVTRGISDWPWSERPSVMRSKPPPDVPIIVRAPANDAPIALFTTAISPSGWKTAWPCFSCCLDM